MKICKIRAGISGLAGLLLSGVFYAHMPSADLVAEQPREREPTSTYSQKAPSTNKTSPRKTASYQNPSIRRPVLPSQSNIADLIETNSLPLPADRAYDVLEKIDSKGWCGGLYHAPNKDSIEIYRGKEYVGNILHVDVQYANGARMQLVVKDYKVLGQLTRPGEVGNLELNFSEVQGYNRFFETIGRFEEALEQGRAQDTQNRICL